MVTGTSEEPADGTGAEKTVDGLAVCTDGVVDTDCIVVV